VHEKRTEVFSEVVEYDDGHSLCCCLKSWCSIYSSNQSWCTGLYDHSGIFIVVFDSASVCCWWLVQVSDIYLSFKRQWLLTWRISAVDNTMVSILSSPQGFYVPIRKRWCQLFSYVLKAYTSFHTNAISIISNGRQDLFAENLLSSEEEAWLQEKVKLWKELNSLSIRVFLWFCTYEHLWETWEISLAK
jgi:hypothetical protein